MRNISKYSSSAADDIITAIKELCENDCKEVLFSTPHSTADTHIEHTGVDLLFALLQGYSSHPKKPSGRLTNEVPWKVAVSGAMTDMFRLISKKPVSGVDSNEDSADLGCSGLESEGFNEDLVHLVLEQLMLLYKATGIQTSTTGRELPA